MSYFIFGLIYLITVGKLLARKTPAPVIIGLPDVENKRMFWLARKGKTRWDEIAEKVPPFLLGVMAGGLIVLFMML